MKKRYSAEQIVAKLRQANVELGKGLNVGTILTSGVAVVDHGLSSPDKPPHPPEYTENALA